MSKSNMVIGAILNFYIANNLNSIVASFAKFDMFSSEVDFRWFRLYTVYSIWQQAAILDLEN